MNPVFPPIRSLLIFPALILYSLSLFSQKIVEIRYDQDAKGSFVFSCMNNGYCNYILDMGFTVFENVKSDQPLPFHGEIKPGYNKLFTISPIDAQIQTKINFSSTFQKGCMHPVVNPEFTYLYPISPGKSAQVYQMSPDKLTDSASWYVLRMKMMPGDTIYAARKGIVNEIQDQNGANDAGQNSIGTENYIEINQPECSFARYGILRKNGALVKPGQAVKAGQPIGIVGGDPNGRGSDIRFSVYYFQEENGAIGQNRERHYIIPKIWTKNNGKSRLKHGAIYVSEFPIAILNQEMPAATPKKRSKKPNT
jgi:Peptidase family M23